MTTIRERYDIEGISRLHDHVGIEMEYEGVPGEVARRIVHVGGWVITDDHSLRDGGAEFISAPTHISRLQGKVSKIVDAFEKENRRPSISHRCSTHIHVNVGDLHLRELEAVYFLFLLLEDSLFERLPFDDRKDNLFALKTAFYSHSLESLLMLGDKQVEAYDNIFLNSGNFRDVKYRGVSLFRTTSIGTVEFRILPAFSLRALKENELFLWARLFLAIMRGLNKNTAFSPTTALSDFMLACNGVSTNKAFFEKYYDKESAEVLTSFFKEDPLLEPETISVLYFLAEKLEIPERYTLK